MFGGKGYFRIFVYDSLFSLLTFSGKMLSLAREGCPLSISAIDLLAGTEFGLASVTAQTQTFASGLEHDYLAEGRKQCLLHLMLSGSREYVTPEETFSVREGCVLLIPDGTRYKTISHACTGIGVCFDLFSPDGKALPLAPGVCRRIPERQERIRALFEALAAEARRRPPQPLRLHGLLVRVLEELLPARDALDALRPALELIEARYRENLPVEDYARACHMSVSWFRKQFSASVGMSPLQYRNELRFREARELWLKGLSTQSIAERVGFCDAGYLLRLYRAEKGVSLRQDAGSRFV